MDAIVVVGQFHYFSAVYKGYGHSPYLIVILHMRYLLLISLILVFLESNSQTGELGISGNIYSCTTNESEFFARGLEI
ncbi:MAG: hypothetical protein RIF34_07100, partial [Candidatus Kapaibacterium sp.]